MSGSGNEASEAVAISGGARRAARGAAVAAVPLPTGEAAADGGGVNGLSSMTITWSMARPTYEAMALCLCRI